MSRRSQDIPIRPRYGIADEEMEAEEKRPKSRKASTSAEPSSYTEIPFLAQYPYPDDHKHSDVTPTEQLTGVTVTNADDEDDDNTNSRDSSCEEENKTPKRPHSLNCDSSFPYELEGATSTDGEMRHFVAENLEEKLRNEQYASQNSTPSAATAGNGGGLLTRHFLQTQRPPQIDPNVLSDIEIEAQYLASSVDNLTENLCNLLHSISSITADNVEVHKNAVNKLTDSMDANIKCMYTIMAKTEEITKSMKPTEQLGQRIREIKRLVDMLDSTM